MENAIFQAAALPSLPYTQHLSSHARVLLRPPTTEAAGSSETLAKIYKITVSFQKTAIVTIVIVETPNLSTIPTVSGNISAETHFERLISKETFISWQHWLPPTLAGRVL
jgi:hypothetical protein